MNRYTGRPLAGAAHLEQSIADILGTPIGTRVGIRDYGSRLPELLDQPNNPLGRLRIFAAAALAILRQESRARVSRVTLSPGDEPTSAVLTVTGTRTDVAGPAAAFAFPVTVRAASALAA